MMGKTGMAYLRFAGHGIVNNSMFDTVNCYKIDLVKEAEETRSPTCAKALAGRQTEATRVYFFVTR
ncbi:MAG: hypothetical protein JW768_13055 [Chitinispirillaceae bacterium]|nr:hypothetical protein [Chitinispirillaceae bacterium]